METRFTCSERIVEILREVGEGGGVCTTALDEEEVVHVGAEEAVEFEELEGWARDGEGEVVLILRMRITRIGVQALLRWSSPDAVAVR